jgi:hypothetical protein
MTFTEDQQKKHRNAFAEECRQKAWGAICHAEWIGKQLERQIGTYQKMQVEDHELGRQIKESESALDYHTVENRAKRKELQERRNKLAMNMKALAENAKQGEQSMTHLVQSADTNMQLAEFAQGWSWIDPKAEAGAA